MIHARLDPHFRPRLPRISFPTTMIKSWLWNMYSLASHQDSAQYEEPYNGMELEHRASSPSAQRYIIQDPTLAHPIRHQRCN